MTRQRFAFPTAGDRADFLSIALETDDPRQFVGALENVIRDRGPKDVAAACACSVLDLNRALTTAAISGAPQLDLMIRTLAALGLRFTVSPRGE